jgi:ERCC4-type nuclease
LLKHFRSVIKVKNATEKELEKIVGLSKARIIKQYFNN